MLFTTYRYRYICQCCCIGCCCKYNLSCFHMAQDVVVILQEWIPPIATSINEKVVQITHLYSFSIAYSLSCFFIPSKVLDHGFVIFWAEPKSYRLTAIQLSVRYEGPLSFSVIRLNSDWIVCSYYKHSFEWELQEQPHFWKVFDLTLNESDALLTDSVLGWIK